MTFKKTLAAVLAVTTLLFGSAVYADEVSTDNTIVVASADSQAVVAIDQEMEVVDGMIILGDDATADDKQYSPMLAHGCHKRSCVAKCPRCTVPPNSNIGHCRKNGVRLTCFKR